MIDPRTITTPIDPRVFPKPASNASMKLFCYTPGIIPNKIIGINRAGNTCHFNFAMRNKSRKITTANPNREIAALVLTAVEGSINFLGY